MVRAMTPSQTLAAFEAEGVPVRGYPGWRDRCRCHDGSHERAERPNGRVWGDVVGQVAHITGGDLGGRSVEQYIRDIINGDPNVPTKSQTVIAPNGDVWLNSCGRCNHAGKVGAGVRAALLGDRFSLTDPYDDRWRGAAVDGNSITYGDEVITSKNMTAAQRASLVKVHAARAKFHRWDGRQSVGHGEISSARYPVDPGLDMGRFRRDVNARLTTSPAQPTPKPKAVTVRVGTLNIPLDSAKLPDGPVRAKAAAAAVHASNLHILGCQEIDRGYPGDTWYYARMFLTALREHDRSWSIAKPTTALNENVTFHRTNRADMKRRLDDAILTSPAGGRHATCSTYTVDGRTVPIRNTHFVSGASNGRSREEQGRQLAAISGGSTIILGDLNQKAVPAALAKTHKSARDSAKATTNAEFGTHAKWGSTKASTADSSFLDHILVPDDAVVNGFTVVGINDDGTFVEPRISDHQLAIASVTLAPA